MKKQYLLYTKGSWRGKISVEPAKLSQQSLKSLINTGNRKLFAIRFNNFKHCRIHNWQSFSIPWRYELTWILWFRSFGEPLTCNRTQRSPVTLILKSWIFYSYTPSVKLFRKGLNFWLGLWTKQDVNYFGLECGKTRFPDWNICKTLERWVPSSDALRKFKVQTKHWSMSCNFFCML